MSPVPKQHSVPDGGTTGRKVCHAARPATIQEASNIMRVPLACRTSLSVGGDSRHVVQIPSVFHFQPSAHQLIAQSGANLLISPPYSNQYCTGVFAL